MNKDYYILIITGIVLLIIGTLYIWKFHISYKAKIKIKSTLLLKPAKPKRERLKLMHSIFTDKAEYYVYNTQTNNIDACNIEIERFDKQSSKCIIILNGELIEDGFGGMGGDSFSHLVLNALCILRDYIKDNNEFIVKETKICS